MCILFYFVSIIDRKSLETGNKTYASVVGTYHD